MNYNVSL